MKKTLSILMSILIIALSFVFVVGAEGAEVDTRCKCLDHKPNPANSCTCCRYCNNVDESWLTTCAKKYDAQGNRIKEASCCTECKGIIPCGCDCPCCPSDSDADSPNAGNGGAILTPGQQEEVVDGFQGVLGRIRAFFDKLFNAIFEFLRFDEIMGNNK